MAAAPPPPAQSAIEAASASRGDPANATGGSSDVEAKSASASCSADESFIASVDVPEASAVAEVDVWGDPAKRELMIVSDSGNHGAALALSLDGKTARKLTLPLDASAGDDLEGAAWHGGKLFTLTSSGAVQVLVPDRKGSFTREGSAYRIGASTESASCPSLTDVNCGRNYEGLCLRAARRAGSCDGYAAGRVTGTLYCVALNDGKLAVAPKKPMLKLAVPPDSLSDCAFGAEGGPAEGTLLVTTNIKGGNETYVVDEKTGALAKVDAPTTLNNEGIAVDHTGALYTFMDTNHTPSIARKATCEGWR